MKEREISTRKRLLIITDLFSFLENKMSNGTNGKNGRGRPKTQPIVSEPLKPQAVEDTLPMLNILQGKIANITVRYNNVNYVYSLGKIIEASEKSIITENSVIELS